MATNWEELAQKKRQALAALIPEQWRIPTDQLPSESERSFIFFCTQKNVLTAEELIITEMSVEDLAKKISTGEYSAVQVCQAYCHRAAIAHQLVNCLTEINFTAALAQAKELDEYFQKNGKTVGMLHGIPVSLKDQYRVKGLESTIGYVGRIGEIDQEESVTTECLRRSGAIIYVKTSVPQSLMIGETINNIFGRTVNPFNRLLSCGGSTGGEGALMGLHGSPLGIGTDIGGSVRIPASFNGLWAIKASHGRLSMNNVSKSLEGQESIRSICGLFAHSSTDLVYFMKALLEQSPWNYDPDVIDLPWRESKYSQGKTGKKTFGIVVCDGVYGYDGVVMPHPPILRGIKMLMQSLKDAGHTVVEWEPYKHGYGVSLFQRLLAGDGGATLRSSLEKSGEPPVAYIKTVLEARREPIDIATLWKVQIDRTTYQKEYLAKWQKQAHIDAWIQPVAPHAAVKHNHYKYYGYTSILNVLDWPSVAIPVTFADQKQDVKNIDYKGRTDLDTFVQETYDPNDYHGAPVGVQLVGRRLQEEYLLGLAEQVNQALASKN